MTMMQADLKSFSNLIFVNPPFFVQVLQCYTLICCYVTLNRRTGDDGLASAGLKMWCQLSPAEGRTIRIWDIRLLFYKTKKTKQPKHLYMELHLDSCTNLFLYVLIICAAWKFWLYTYILHIKMSLTLTF